MGNSTNPKIVLLFSGKRKSGKDYVTDLLFSKLNQSQTVVIKISGPIKSYWAECNNLELKDLLSSSSYKEQHRREMIEWSEEQRSKDPGIFCQQAVHMYQDATEKPIWIVSDVRRKTDISWFQEMYPGKIKTVRIEASEEARKTRGWIFAPGIDDEASECDLDDYNGWDWKLVNNKDNSSELDSLLTNVISCIDSMLKG